MRTDLITREEIQRAFPSRIQPIRTTTRYRLGLAAVLVTMIALQAAYLALVLATASLTVWWVILIPSIFSAVRLNWFSVVLAVGPPVAGAIVTFFLFKPIFIRPLKPAPLPEVTRDEQPELFAFVDALCSSVGVRPPAVIALTLDVNASASLRRGWWSLFRHDLQLTIGLPLVAGLSLRQLTGVLAHEFGHFAQTAGLRSWFVIQNIRNWFARVAYERDRWDLKLEEWQHESEGWRTRSVLSIASFAVEGSRAILRALLRGAGLVSTGFSRQMEFNADHFEAALVGADTFAATTVDIPAIEVATRHSWRQVEESWQVKRLVNNFPRLVQHHWDGLGADARASIQESVLAEQTDRYATHPSPEARIANVKRENLPGVFTLDGPAERLFRNFPELCARVTEQHYSQTLGDDKERAVRVEPEAVVADIAEEGAYECAREALLPGANFVTRWFIPAEGKGSGGTDDELYGNLLSKLLTQEGGAAILEAGGRIEPAAFNVARSYLPSAQDAAASTRSELAATAQSLRADAADVAARIWRLPPNDCSTAYHALCAEQSHLLELRVELIRGRILRANIEHLAAAAAANALQENSNRMERMTSEILARLDSVPSPIALNEVEESLAAQLRIEAEAAEAAAWVLDRAELVGTRLLNRLCWQIESCDKLDVQEGL